MTLSEAQEETDVASGTFLVNQVLAKILFYYGAARSLISYEFGRKLRLSPLRLTTPILVEVAGNEFHQELLLFKLSKFDVSLSMDWLGENLADILCGQKMVLISPPRRKLFFVYKDKCRVKSGIIMMMKARRCLSK